MDPAVTPVVLLIVFIALLALFALTRGSGQGAKRSMQNTSWQARRQMDKASSDYLNQVSRQTRR
jgi:hypothetical protein